MDQLADLADKFVLVLSDRIQGFDLRLFDYDYDLTLMIFFMNADEHIYGRFGGRDASGAEDRMSLPGLRFAMQAALDAHKKTPDARPPAREGRPVLPEQYPLLRAQKGCVHCHQIWEARRHEAKTTGTYNRDDLWIYPLPENIGLSLDLDEANRVNAVEPGSPAARAGIAKGDVVRSINRVSVASFGDAQYALHRAPAKGTIPIEWEQNGKARSADLELREGWRRTNPTWRPSMLDILPSISLYGDDLTAEEKKALKLSEKRLAFRQDSTVQKDARRLGVQGGDIITGVNDQVLEMTMLEFLGYIRKNFVIGDTITLNIIRDGKPMKLSGQL